jgi:hypothetical protein
MQVAARSRSTFGAMMAAGVVALLFIHILINCGMVMGLLPVVEAPMTAILRARNIRRRLEWSEDMSFIRGLFEGVECFSASYFRIRNRACQ